jgi:hypothetical protein
MSTGADISALYREFTDALTEVGRDWNFSPRFDLAAMTADMLERLGPRINARKIGA